MGTICGEHRARLNHRGRALSEHWAGNAERQANGNSRQKGMFQTSQRV
jgi:hypothetical protein